MGIRRKLEWLKPYHEYATAAPPRRGAPLGPKTTETDASNEIIEYQKGEIIEVEEMGRGNFRDVQRNINFLVEDESQYRLSEDEDESGVAAAQQDSREILKKVDPA